MSNIHLRGLDDRLTHQLKQVAVDQSVSVNTLILNILRQGLGLSRQHRNIVYHDLDKLAGTWTGSEAEKFMKNIADFESIDKALWK